ncbi:DUF971 family protein [Rhodoblastus acidophilus]|uniref:DUF971 family protein n=1 Tax=Rhodoblastus acidophilus TaxID=1074 RepID=A0A212QPJ6_RHOAC|nr:DUF971 domain-containing protein [Rhodoblastus acidophilus]MCW2317977.1 DUF971 family protein [Rhodoblastus acidophilus]PPQ36128.1 DUF971 domain-containing protein [Rhodoblastus acidophilus]RAI16656.1 DUF971 domain-containing protein [Rhodoblastus acidophilus]SNB61355.1 DUF971 family protein [Rhodoblastus acidophilus]
MGQRIPDEIRLSDAGAVLHLIYGPGEAYALPAEYLRVLTPSAEARGHGGQGGQTVSGKAGVRIAGVEPVGNYALKLIFDDGHATGLYTWDYLRELSLDQEAHWRAYLEDLAAQGLSR